MWVHHLFISFTFQNQYSFISFIFHHELHEEDYTVPFITPLTPPPLTPPPRKVTVEPSDNLGPLDEESDESDSSDDDILLCNNDDDYDDIDTCLNYDQVEDQG